MYFHMIFVIIHSAKAAIENFVCIIYILYHYVHISEQTPRQTLI